MDNKLLNKILDREDVANQIKYIVQNYEENTKDIQYKKGIYIYGSPGCGKTQFVVNTLKEANFDVIKYDAGDVRNKSLIDTITSNNVSKYNVLHMMTGQLKKIAIVMDEIDGMNSGDKGGITSLIKLIRQKKTKKQKTENATMNPIICIGNYFMDKKIRELMKVCHVFELKMPTREQTDQIKMSMMPDISSILSEKNEMNDDLVSIKEEMLNYAQGDMRKISFLHKLYTKQREVLTPDLLRSIFHV